MLPCLNPLHCGAVVASARRAAESRAARLVSIPFIAGQWSLRDAEARAARIGEKFQSPSLRGSGRFSSPTHFSWMSSTFQSPSLRGSGRFTQRRSHPQKRRRSFQSPSLRGSGRFERPPPHGGGAKEAFQSPSLRGSGRFASGGTLDPQVRWFQSPSLRGSGRFSWRGRRGPARRFCFNPLHCGAVVASGVRRAGRPAAVSFQSPSLRGSGRFRCSRRRSRRCRRVSIPFIAGQWSLHGAERAGDSQPPGFNPLHCGAVVASRRKKSDENSAPAFQSPSLRGSGRFGGARRP